MNIHIENSPVNGYLTTEQKTKIAQGLQEWKSKNTEFKVTESFDELFWILCEYDHSHAPSNWDIEFKHWNTIADWSKWFMEKHPERVSKLLKMRKETNGDNKEVCQCGIISNYLFPSMIDFYC